MLPPSTPYMDKLALGEEIPAGPLLLHSLIWGPRAAYKTFTGWMKVNFNCFEYFKNKICR
jgi:E3 ubiquitin-protein ligase UBR4